MQTETEDTGQKIYNVIVHLIKYSMFCQFWYKNVDYSQVVAPWISDQGQPSLGGGLQELVQPEMRTSYVLNSRSVY